MMNLATWFVSKRFSHVQHVDTQNVSDRADDVIVVDARRLDEYEVSHLPNAKRLHFMSSDQDLEQFVDEFVRNGGSKDVVCYCSLGYRSAILTDRLNQIAKRQGIGGNVRVLNMEGSIFKWANENRPLFNGSGHSTSQVHPFSYLFSWFLDPDKRFWPEN